MNVRMKKHKKIWKEDVQNCNSIFKIQLNDNGKNVQTQGTMFDDENLETRLHKSQQKQQ